LYIGLLAVHVDAAVIHLHSTPLYEELVIIISNFEIAFNMAENAQENCGNEREKRR
jgi:hypothetical protein